MPTRNQFPPQERHLRSTLLKELSTLPLLKGRLYSSARTCGKPRCRCTRGQKHVSLYLHVCRQGKLKRISIPKELEASVREAVENYRRVEEKLQTLSQAQLQRVLEEKEARGHARSPP
jgi:GrpB-like predicted nucleotidyltransferase (UPF0157 family)